MPVRRRQPRRRETGAAERYREMGISAALSRPWDYPTACGEIAALLRIGYGDLPKAAQALVAGDVLLAFRLLPDVQTGYALSAANGLLQAVDGSLQSKRRHRLFQSSSVLLLHISGVLGFNKIQVYHIYHTMCLFIFSVFLTCAPW